jgi:uncharacterized protein YqjF (DUF2071 family)
MEIMRMTWRRLLFLHWPVPADVLRKRIPDGLTLDTFDGKAWLGIVPFTMVDVAPAGVPALPYFSAFHELNVRTYVTDGRKPGVWFFSLDAANLAAVAGARTLFGLPYHHARMRLEERGDETSFQSRRSWDQGRHRFRGHYRPRGPVFQAREGSLDHWLTERHCLYSPRGGRLLRLDVIHDPWPLQPAEARVEENLMAEGLGVELRGEPLLHYAENLQVRAAISFAGSWTEQFRSIRNRASEAES